MKNKTLGFKAFGKDWKCRDLQYKVGETFEVDSKIELCGNGLHYCKMPLDVLNYYPFDSKFAKVEALGEIKSDVDKSVTNKLKIETELSFKDLFNCHFNLVFEKITKCKETTNTSGNYAHANTSGNYAHANTSRYKAHANTSRYKAHANTSGDDAHANTSGDEAHANTSGDEAIASSLGINSKAKAEKGWIIIVDWRQDKKYNWYIENIYNSKVGGKIKNKKIKSNCWYWFENGELKEEIEK